MTPDVPPPARTVVPDPDAYVATPVARTVTTSHVVSRDVETDVVAEDARPWLWLLGLLALLLIAAVAYFATRGNDTAPASTPSPGTTVIVNQPPAQAPPAQPPVIVQQPPVIVQQPPAQAPPAQSAAPQASQPAPAAS